MEFFLRSLLASLGLGPSKEKLEKAEAYKKAMFPLGDEEQKLVSQHLQRVISDCPVNKTMFVFLAIKETYLNAQRDGLSAEQCAEKARAHAAQLHVVPKDQLPYLFSFAMLELRLDDLSRMPDVERVLQLQRRLFPDSYDAPDWSALYGKESE